MICLVAAFTPQPRRRRRRLTEAPHLSLTAAVFVKLYDFPIHPSSLSTQFKPLISASFHR